MADVTREDWMDAINDWFRVIEQPDGWTWEMVEKTEGDDHRRTVNQVLRMPDTTHYRWFASGQMWTQFYDTPEYLFSLLYCFDRISRPVYQAIAQCERGGEVVDVGGSIMSAFEMLDRGVKRVYMTNFDDSPQVEFARYFIANAGIRDDEITIVPHNDFPRGLPIITCEYLEHFPIVDIEVDRLLTWSPPRWYDKNAFCMAAYGHYIPITIDGTRHSVTSGARDAFVRYMRTHDYHPRRIDVEKRELLCFEPGGNDV